jgi:MFS family permease
VITEGELRPIRRRALSVLIPATASSSLAVFIAFPVMNIMGEQLSGSRAWSGLPSTFLFVGSALASQSLSAFMARAGRRRGLVLGYLVCALGAGLTVWAARLSSFPLMLVGSLLFGVGLATGYLSRYTAADVALSAQRGKAISLVLWAFVIGALLGPNLLVPALEATEALRLPELSGPFVIAAAAVLVAALLIGLLLRPDPMEIARRIAPPSESNPRSERHPIGESLRTPPVQVAMAAIVFSQLSMIMVMSMTAVHMHALQLSFSVVGFVLSAHFVGMFALSPATGWAADRFGRTRLIVAGATTLVAAALVAAVGSDRETFLFGGLFLLGVGWNMCFVSGSALLTDSVPHGARAQMQGFTDLLSGGMSALSSLASGVILAALGFPALALLAAGLMLAPLAVVAARRRAIQPALT